jgi:hypothetical protein
MSSSSNYPEKLSDLEVAKLIEDIKNHPLQFATTEGIDSHQETAERFVKLVLNLEWASISDESSLNDFSLIEDSKGLEEKIKEVFGVDVSDIEDGNLLKIFERIDGIV